MNSNSRFLSFEKFKKYDLVKIATIMFFVLYLIVGLFCVKDYGVAVDEPLQRNHSLVTYKYINKVLFNRDVVELLDYPNLEDYGALYGVAIQLPTVFIEDLHDFSMSTREIYLMRHYYNFLFCYIGYIFFYFALKRILGKEQAGIVPLLGTMMISLYPRFFSNQMVDVKNLIFASTFMIVIYFTVRVVEEKKMIWQLLFALSLAFCVNTRIMGIIILPVLLGFYFLRDITDIVQLKKENSESVIKEFGSRIVKYFIISLSFAVFWILITPKAWIDPAHTFVNTYRKFSNFTLWDGTMVFMGKLITCDEMPWYYLFVWYGISIPILCLALFAVSHIFTINKFIKEKDKWNKFLTDYKWWTFNVILFWGSTFAVIIKHSRIYIGWHHMYFVFVPFCLLASLGLKELIDKFSNRKKVIISIVSILLFVQTGWMVAVHPYESSYFNVIGKMFATDFDREEWRICSYSLMEWVLENDDSEQLTFSGEMDTLNLLTDEEKSRITVVDSGDADYIFDFYRDVIGNDLEYEGYEEVKTAWVDGYKVGSVFKKVK